MLGQRLSCSRNGRTVSYAYTANGQVGQVGYWNRGSMQVGYDAAGRLSDLAPWGSAATSYAYRSTGLLSSEARPNGVNTLYSYDTASRLTGVNGIQYILDANGARTQMSDWEGVTSYSYDALDRLMQTAYPTSTMTYTLDSVGNRLSDGVTSFAYDPSDRITNPGFTYDANGNLLSDGTATYEYDAANRLIQTTRNGVVTTYGYDGWGNLIQETTNGVTTEFVLDENTAYTRILGEVRSDGGERFYAYGAEGLSAQQTVGGGVEYPLLDGLGSVRQLTDAGGTVILTRSYDAYGNVRYAAGTGSSRLGYTGELQDPASGLVYLRARHYHPVLGRFLQRDSFEGYGQRPQSLNRYSYTENNPINLVDPSGHCIDGISTIFCAIAVAAVIGAATNATGNVVGQFVEQYDGNRNFIENLRSTQINGQAVAIAAGWGAVGGGVAPVTGPIGFVAVNALTGAGQKVTTDVVVNGRSLQESIFDPNTILAAGINAAGAKLAGQVPKVPSYVAINGEEIFYATGRDATEFGGKQFADTTGRILLAHQVESSLAPRTGAAAIITNLPYSISQECANPWDCLMQFMLGGAIQKPELCNVNLNNE